MTHSTSAVSLITVGLDVGDRRTHFCALDGERTILSRGSVPTTKKGLEDALRHYLGAKLVLEAGPQSPWMTRVLRAQGYQVQVAGGNLNLTHSAIEI